MANILFLVHRIPYPPNKGDKIRSWHFLNHLAKNHRIHLGFYVDDPQDLDYIKVLEGVSESLSYVTVSPFVQKVRSLRGLLTGKPLTLEAYPLRTLKRYVKQCLTEKDIDLVFLYSAATAQLLPDNVSVPVVTDLVDVDSDKWAAYATSARWPLSSVFRREARVLGAYEVSLVSRFERTLLVSEAEAAVLKKKLSTNNTRVSGIPNGVDTAHFQPNPNIPVQDNLIIFTGAMNYAPNIEAVEWFAKNVWPLVTQSIADAVFRIAGGPRNARIEALQKYEGIEVTGYVEDMADELAAAAIAVAPMLTARGIQNKVLEAMASAKPVVATSLANEGIEAKGGREIYIADSAAAFAETIVSLLRDKERAAQIGLAARRYVEKEFSWATNCAKLDALIGEVLSV